MNYVNVMPKNMNGYQMALIVLGGLVSLKHHFVESVEVMVKRVKDFIKPGQPHTKDDTMKKLNNHMDTVKTMSGGVEQPQKMHTETGLKDMYQMFFVEKIVNAGKYRQGVACDSSLEEAVESLPESFESFNAVIWFKSTHSNHATPSRASVFAQTNHISHTLSQGHFLL
ncbi:hypothetical protein L218DRAFT_1002643 [Marasmius fiardii PR-910]|nr:hypothetical protein L218DRAFT_1002643 [Marasmius fiardii PR-910]